MDKILNNRLFRYLIAAYILFSILNLLLFEGIEYFNRYTFVSGGFLYLSVFLIVSFKHLQLENFSFFYSNDYLLLFSPVFFFLGLSFYFGFKDSSIGNVEIIKDLRLYDVIIYFVNILYYGLITVFILREKRIRNAK
ncbi:hypothetical protein R1T16_03265 [Flavobacterium sp. DG1-102-2]|uniref:hypothetical protein n=1 Tax=Flavobacterium sp. DG1-102-2 TaxID=3081663 RepID=UPI002949D132|nr:hypothetical protein [Flavobacterium sp. DG1-102-2]MDV6167429.1 hypothetical protein [Flavobacterium sp. DG1-102-2]